MVAGQSFVGDELHVRAGTDGRGIRHFKNRGCFIDFVKHRHIEHIGAHAFRGGDLRPEEAAMETGNIVERRSGLQVVPAETGKGDGEKVDLTLAAPRDVRLQIGRGVRRGGLGCAVATGRPRGDYFGKRDEFKERRIGDRIAAEGAPPAGHAEHDREATTLFVVF